MNSSFFITKTENDSKYRQRSSTLTTNFHGTIILIISILQYTSSIILSWKSLALLQTVLIWIFLNVFN